MRRKSLTILGLIFLSLGGLYAQQNNKPIVRITSPQNGSTQPLNTLVRYAVTVSDREDGESIYGEINATEVFLSVRYLADTTRIAFALKQAEAPDPPGFVLLQKSNCVNCHAFTAPLIGPSFTEITKRYPSTRTNQTLLVRRVLEGSSGIWGSTAMPGHPELSPDAALEIISWILDNTRDGKIKYYPGIAGTLRLNLQEGDRPGGVFLLRASYTDRGLGNQLAQHGNATLIVKGQ